MFAFRFAFGTKNCRTNLDERTFKIHCPLPKSWISTRPSRNQIREMHSVGEPGRCFSAGIIVGPSIQPAAKVMLNARKSRRKHLRIVLKFGSGILTRMNAAGLDVKQFARLSAEVAALIHAGHQCVMVTSGAVAAGTRALSLTERPTDLATAQASAAVGQSKLMRAWETAFARYKLDVAQLLLTYSDLDSYVRRANAGNTLERLLSAGNIVPIINENDSVATEELSFGDNDRLSAEVATLARANLLIILTGVDGLLDANGNVIPRVRDVDGAKRLANGSKGRLSVG